MDDILYKPLHEVSQIQDAKLRKMIALCFCGHPFYQKRFKEIGLKQDDIMATDALEKLPLTFKKDYLNDPESFRLRIDDLPVTEKIVWDVMFTAGTSTGKPVPFYSTAHDFFSILESNRRAGRIRGFKETDRMANLYPLTHYPHGAFTRAINAATVLGCPIVSTLTGTSYPEFPVHNSIHDAIDLLERTKPTVVWVVPSFLRKLLITAGENNADLSSVRYFALTGERVTKGLRRELVDRASSVGIKNPIVNVSLGSTEMQVGCIECQEFSGFHNPAPDLFFLEIVDEKTFKRVPDGEMGLLTLTHLNRRGTVLLRYALGDLTSLTHERCPHCGRTSERIDANPVRVGELTKIRGMLVNKETLEEQLTASTQIDEFQVVLTKSDPDDPYSMDEIIIKLATSYPDKAFIEKEITDKIKNAIGVRPRIVFMDRDKIYDGTRMKMVRVVDIRKQSE